ncbi:hypothetical protein [Streptomyces sp. UH6]|uniref:hypothetical protein n=1 Tax=Streptomyces sp. UH6 TaxID=2748379 RepID=UPI0015D498C6|nr:hypothetical protein [Streptomyces sp. UH6]NYV73692.1 hypothetical protein [Streptomyces sp. UH6]
MARQMVAFGVAPYSEVSVEAAVPTVAEVKRLADPLPDAWLTSWNTGAPATPPPGFPDLNRPAPIRELSGDLAWVEPYLPVGISMLDQPVGSIEDRFAAVVGPHLGEIRWTSLAWPEVPDQDFCGEYNHAEVTMLFNCDSRELEPRTDQHTVLVHVRRRNGDGYEDRRAAWLAERIGQKVVGPPQHV